MARGWESKSVEAQQDSAARERPSGSALTPEEAARRTRRDTLRLARLRALADLRTACAPSYRSMLEGAIADLDRQLAALE